MRHHRFTALSVCVPSLALGLMSASSAQTNSTAQSAKPPEAQVWIDVATFSGFGMPTLGSGSANPLAALGNLLGGGAGGAMGAAKVNFLMTQSGGSGRFVDVTLMTRRNGNLAEAVHEVPSSFLNPALSLVAPRSAPAAPTVEGDEVQPETQARPEAKISLYWGCGDTIRAGQPRVFDLGKAVAADMAQFFQSRRATQRGAHAASGRPHWPNATDGRALPEAATLVGAHQLKGEGVPEGFRFNIQAAQDVMPAMRLQSSDQAGALALSWAALPTARAYFLSGMSARERNEMVLWTSSELPDLGMGLMDYQTNAAVDRWLREKVVLAPTTTSCTVPKGIFPAEGTLLRAIAYGSELNVVHPPRPLDPKQAWEPLWAAKVRVKSVVTTMAGMPQFEAPTGREEKTKPDDKPATKKPSALDILRGVIGR